MIEIQNVITAVQVLLNVSSVVGTFIPPIGGGGGGAPPGGGGGGGGAPPGGGGGATAGGRAGGGAPPDCEEGGPPTRVGVGTGIASFPCERGGTTLAAFPCSALLISAIAFLIFSVLANTN